SSSSAANRANRHKAERLPQLPLRDRLQRSKVVAAAVVVVADNSLRQRQTLSPPANRQQQRLHRLLPRRLRLLKVKVAAVEAALPHRPQEMLSKARRNKASSNSNRVMELTPKVEAAATSGALSRL